VKIIDVMALGAVNVGMVVEDPERSSHLSRHFSTRPCRSCSRHENAMNACFRLVQRVFVLVSRSCGSRADRQSLTWMDIGKNDARTDVNTQPRESLLPLYPVKFDMMRIWLC